jgi:hypothetical protein
MLPTSSGRLRTFLLVALGLLAAALVPAAASAATETFHRFEFEATANYTLTETCPDGSTRTTRVTVIAGHEEEAVNREPTLDNDFLTVLIRGFDCDFNLINIRASGPAEFSFSPSLQTASVTGTVAAGGRTIAVDMSWEGTGAIESTSNTTTFPGFAGHFKGKERDAVARDTVVLDDETLVDGSTTNAELETLEDHNVTIT